MAETIYKFTYYCPRCDRPYISMISWLAAEEMVKTHVKKAHPDHDPNWFETYPESYGN